MLLFFSSRFLLRKEQLETDKYRYLFLIFLNPFSDEIDFPGIVFSVDDKFIFPFEYNTGGGVTESPFSMPIPPAEVRLPGLLGFEYGIDIILISGKL